MSILETYLKTNNLTLREFHLKSGIPETTIRNLNRKPLKKWTLAQIEALSDFLSTPKEEILKDLETLSLNEKNHIKFGKFSLESRRYIGSKAKLLPWISELIKSNTKGKSFFDVFAGTGIVTEYLLDEFDTFYINDFLYSNNLIYCAFFGNEKFDQGKIEKCKEIIDRISYKEGSENYISRNFANTFFSQRDAYIIGEIRESIELFGNLNNREKSILISSLLYSVDKIANTVGHYDAYRKIPKINDRFVFELINPINTSDKKINIYREDANNLVASIYSDVVFIDPPYNSRQYSRFYHILENIAKWQKPELEGVALKPPKENMSEYSKKSAPEVFEHLISNINAKYIVVTYNNTYNSKSNSSKNKITHEQILNSLNKVGKTKVFEKPFKHFNAGKSNLIEHKEFVFITELRNV